jgi:hypothetical protein
MAVGRSRPLEASTLVGPKRTDAEEGRQLQADPALSRALLPARWLGVRLRDTYTSHEREIAELLRRQHVHPG